MNDPRICIIGAGSLATKRIYPYIGAAGGDLVGVCDLDAEKRERNARRFGGLPCADFHKMLDDLKPDCVIICVGPAEHAKLAPEVLRLGYPVYTEKPPATSAADALAVARVAKQTGLLCTTAFKKRYASAHEHAREFIREFPASELYSISIDYASSHYANDSPRRTFLLDFAIHAIDLVQYLGGDVAEVFAFTKGSHAYSVSLRFANGAVGSMNLSDGRGSAIPTEEVEITLRGGNSMTVHNSSCWRIGRQGAGAEWREPPTFVSAGDSGNETGHLAEIVDFLAAVREGRTTRSNIYESYKTMVLYEAIRDSAQSGELVDVRFESV